MYSEQDALKPAKLVDTKDYILWRHCTKVYIQRSEIDLLRFFDLAETATSTQRTA